MTNKPTSTSKKNLVGLVLGRSFGMLFALTGIIVIFSDPIPGIVMLIMAAVLIPNVRELAEQKWKFHLSKGMKIGVIFIGLIIFGTTIDTSDVSTTQQIKNTEQTNSTQQEIVFDLNKLYKKNIDEIRSILGEPLDWEYTNPTEQQLQLGTKEWDNTFEIGKYELLVTYNISSKEIIDFFVSTDDTSGATKDTKKLEKLLNIENSPNFIIEAIKTMRDPSVYTGIKVTPKK